MLAPGLLLEDRYRLDSRIAAGGMGEVWRGTDLALRRVVAIKLLLPEYAWEAEAAARFRAEARHAGMVTHPNIARIFDYSEGGADDADGGGTRRPYLVMELVDGPSLGGLLTVGPVGVTYTLDVLMQVSAGLAAAHVADLVHRDIKPANLLISGDGLVKITDFGIAHAAGAAPMTKTGVLVGTGAYLAPERAAGTQAGPAADLYSLGVVAYECLTGYRPFNGDPLEVVMAHQTQPLPALPPEIPEPVAELVASLTAKDPGVRPASAGEVGAHAEWLRGQLGDIPSGRSDLPPLAVPIVSTGPQQIYRPAEVATPPAGDQYWESTRSVSGLPSAELAGDDGADSDLPPDGRHGRRLGAGLAAAAVIALATLGTWAFGGLSGQPQHMRVTGQTHAAVPHSAKPRRHTGSAPPVPAATSAVGTMPAAGPATSVAGQVPAAPPAQTPRASNSYSKPATPTPSRTTSPPPSTSTPTPTPTGTQIPTPTPTATASSG